LSKKWARLLKKLKKLTIVYQSSIILLLIFNPKYTISNKLLSNIKIISEIVAELNNRSFPRIVLLNMERRAHKISAYSSTSIKENPLPLTAEIGKWEKI